MVTRHVEVLPSNVIQKRLHKRNIGIYDEVNFLKVLVLVVQKVPEALTILLASRRLPRPLAVRLAAAALQPHHVVAVRARVHRPEDRERWKMKDVPLRRERWEMW